jgi:hypothetical protein
MNKYKHQQKNYKLYLFKENDNINLIFDKYSLVDTLTELYHKIGIVNRIDTNYEITEDEKNIVMSVIGENMNIRCDENDQTIKRIGDIINATKVLSSLSSNLMKVKMTPEKDVKSINVSVPKPILFRNDRNDCEYDTTQSSNPELSSYFSEVTTKQTINNDEMEGFGDNGQYSYLVNEVLREFDEKYKRSYYVLYNSVYEAVLICVKSASIDKCVQEFKDFKLIREYEDLMDITYNKINEYFSKNMYCTEEMLIKKLDAFESLYDIDKRCPLEKEKRLILYYINSNYNISNNVENRIKVSILLDNVQKELRINDVNLKYRFTSILYEIGLQKKRYSDGMYVYGIQPKSELKIVDKEYVKNLSINNIIEKRQQEMETTH